MLLYLHIPFCDSKCSYCAFNSYVDQFHLKENYMRSIMNQLSFELEKFEVKKNSIESIFIGGGTPSTVDAELYEPFFKKIEKYLKDDIEITTEANPNSATQKWLKQMKDLGVNRVSFGVQSFDEQKLKFLGRAHNSKDALNAIENAALAHFDHISVDLIYGVKNDTKELLRSDIDIAMKLGVDHISAYSLTIEESTKFEDTPEVATDSLEQTHFLFDHIKSYGFTQYEISNFGKYRSTHNIGYWQYKDYIGIGSGAVGCLRERRFYPSTDIKSYITDPIFHSVENLSQDDIKNEKIFLGLRSFVGVEQAILTPLEIKKADLLVDEKKLYFKDKKYFNLDYLLSDELALFITS